MVWDPVQYRRYASERSRPFFDLVGQVEADTPAHVVDLGCGSGELTATLAQRWPDADVRGVDSSPQMLAKSEGLKAGRLSFTLAAAQDFEATDVDVLTSNALLQWVPEHRSLLMRWAAQLNPDGWLAFGVPANFGAPSHTIMRELTESPRWRDQLGDTLRHADAVDEPQDYLDLLSAAGLATTVWQTTYLHVLQGPDPVLQWVSGTGLRPVLAALGEADRSEFTDDYAARLREAYPQRPYGTPFSFTRTFVVGHKPAGGSGVISPSA